MDSGAKGSGRSIAVLGATGLQGGAVVRRLLREGWHVKALTRSPDGKAALGLAALGAEVVGADMDDAASLEAAFDAVHGVYSVQNHHISGYVGEVRQGRNVAGVAHRSGVGHLVYAATGTGARGTGIGSWDAKTEVIDHVAKLDVPLTVLRPMAFMELMTESKFYPPVSVWHVMPKLMGSDRPAGWISVDDLAVVAAMVFADAEQFAGRDLSLLSDVRSIDECRVIWRDVMGKAPRRFPMPVWLFEKFTGTDETTMWRWLASNDIDLDPEPMREIHPEALTVRTWLERGRASRGSAAGGGGGGDERRDAPREDGTPRP